MQERLKGHLEQVPVAYTRCTHNTSNDIEAGTEKSEYESRVVKGYARRLRRPVEDVDVLVRSRLYMVDELVDDLQRC